MVAYCFPPAGGIAAAGSQRTLKFAKYLPHQGWEPVVLTVRESSYESYLELDPTLLKRVPSEVKIIRTSVVRWMTELLKLKKRLQGTSPANEQSKTPASNIDREVRLPSAKTWYQSLKDSLTDLFEIPDGEIGWFVPAVVAGMRAVRTELIDVIYSTGKPWTAHLISLTLKKLTGKPLVTDFRDPWMTNPFRDQASVLRNRTEAFLERRVIESSDIVITNTVSLREEFIRRFPDQLPDKFVTLLNGYDPDDFPRSHGVNEYHDGRFVITHTGFLYGKRDPRCFLEALELLLANERVDRNKIEVVFVGSVELSYDLPEYLNTHGLDQIVTLVPHVPYQQSLEYLSAADMLLLLQPGTETQVPSKLFEYIALGKPILAISPREGATSKLVAEECLGLRAEAGSVDAIASVMERLYRDWAHGAVPLISNGREREKFNVKTVTSILAQKLNQLVSERADPYSRDLARQGNAEG
jgi:glycosyltransferase involved in cell wall biosynthesis